jgi:sugar lactone lactonase YvrE
VEKILPDGTRSVFLDGIASPAGIAVDGEGAVYVASYSGDCVVRVGVDGSRTTVAEGLATPTGLAFSKDGRLLVANRSSGEIVALDLQSGQKSIVATSLSLPVGVVEMPDNSLVVTQYGGRVTRVMPDGAAQEIGQEFSRPGVGIIADGNDAVLAVDNGADVVRRVDFGGQSAIVSEKLPGSAVALGRDGGGRVLAGAWGTGNIYVIE